jgi:hypothetical protein
MHLSVPENHSNPSRCRGQLGARTSARVKNFSLADAFDSELGRFRGFVAIRPEVIILLPFSITIFPKLSHCFVLAVPKANIKCYNMCIRGHHFSHRRQFLMRPSPVITFHHTVRFCFNTVMETTGTSVRDVIYERLERRGTPASACFRLDSMMWWQVSLFR